MEASSTTLNIQSPVIVEPAAPVTAEAEAPNWFGHTHKYPNFGRFVKGCAACVAKREEKAEAKAPSSRIEELEAEIEQLRQQQKPAAVGSATDQLVEIMLRNEADKVRVIEEEKARKASAREQMLQVERERIAQERAVQAACSHTKENGRTAILASQIHNDGFIHPFCQRCGREWAKYRPSHEQMPTAV